jgi:hypothetical protein
MPILLWLLGIPIPLIILIMLFASLRFVTQVAVPGIVGSTVDRAVAN